MKQNRSRFGYAIVILVVIGIGLASRTFPVLFPRFMGKYPGDAFWALMIFLVGGVVFPGISTARLKPCPTFYAARPCPLFLPVAS